jgi:hypothetical protein
MRLASATRSVCREFCPLGAQGLGVTILSDKRMGQLARNLRGQFLQLPPRSPRWHTTAADRLYSSPARLPDI